MDRSRSRSRSPRALWVVLAAVTGVFALALVWGHRTAAEARGEARDRGIDARVVDARARSAAQGVWDVLTPAEERAVCAAYRRNAGVLLEQLDRAYGGASETRTALDRLLARRC